AYLGHWEQPDTWDAVLQGATKAFVMAPNGVSDPAFVERAATLGVEHVVLLSSRGIEAVGDERLMAAERAVETSGAAWTILRPDAFDQNFDEGFFRQAVAAGELVMPFGDLKQAFVDADDIAAVAAAALTTTGHAGRRYEVTGPRSLTYAEALDIIAGHIGHPVRYQGSDEDYFTAQKALGRTRAETEPAVAAFRAIRAAGDHAPTGTVEQVTGRKARPFEDYAATVDWAAL
ncbi:SDR family NAD(P)-dependent oxidoreductase, partial [Streptomyces sp. NPDC059788]|uniref:SDR family NAD(P)-dependent oxidoreductase n=1 Tax=Streptomyces sp. NPDC059788 TaxID=3346948 RepID=UPI00365A6279